MKQTDVRIDAANNLAIKFQHKAEHAVGSDPCARAGLTEAGPTSGTGDILAVAAPGSLEVRTGSGNALRGSAFFAFRRRFGTA
jgi:hypothetical protein